MGLALVLNEWVFHDLLHQNEEEHFRETARFLISFKNSNDLLVIPPKKRWKQKAYRLMSMSDTAGREASKLLRSLMLDADRSINAKLVQRDTISKDFLDRLPPEDVYLVLAYVASEADLLVTTDGELFGVVAEEDGFNCRMRHDFLSEYLKSGP